MFDEGECGGIASAPWVPTLMVCPPEILRRKARGPREGRKPHCHEIVGWGDERVFNGEMRESRETSNRRRGDRETAEVLGIF